MRKAEKDGSPAGGARRAEAPSRREIIGTALAVLAGMGISAVTPTKAFAGLGDPVLLGGINDAVNGTTYITSSPPNSTTTGPTLYVFNYTNNAQGAALFAAEWGTSATGEAVVALNMGLGKAIAAQNSAVDNPQPVIHALQNGTGCAIEAEGGRAQLRLKPASFSGAPYSGTHSLGEISTDSTGVMYRCVAAGTPGTWAPIRSTVVLPTPVRVIDTRSGLGGVWGPLSRGVVHTFASFLATVGIPVQATGIVGNLTMVSPNSDPLHGGGWMAIAPASLPHGSSAPPNYPGVSTINAPSGTDACANHYTVALGTGGYAGCVSIVVWDNPNLGYHALLDVAGYII